MKSALACSTLAAVALLLSVPACAAEPPAATTATAPDAAFVRQVNAFVDGWHDDAAHTRPAYFDKIAPQGVYIGTDKSEIWTRDQFKAWARPFWERKKAWSFTAQKRNVYYSPDRRYVWFDEQLSTQMGTCQASGVLRNTGDGFLVEHYQLSMAVPNALNAGFAKAIAEYESKAPR
ncbi:nuclear transport factor 2 family protein [[Empedobacter] haloabium]|uniref:Nuclear transport factor 2 family protein n=1 Tax=[Empedobacter] haloabium TaxID=592317 RepID=A0ABZ1UJ38_9BURK